jgi:heat shock protein HslJ
MRITSLFISSALALAVPVASQNPPIEGVSWRLMKISTLDDAILDQSPRAIARFRDGVLSGFSACNRFKGSYRIAGDRVDIGHQTHTVNKCSDPAVEVEDSLKRAFNMPVRYTLADGRLKLTSENGTTMTFEAEPAHALEGVEWEVVEFNDGKGAFVAPTTGTTMSFSFRDDGAVVGNSGCNLFKAAYLRDGERLTVDQPVATTRKCPGFTIMDREQAFLAALTGPKTWTLRGELLDLFLADGQRGLTAGRPAQ